MESGCYKSYVVFNLTTSFLGCESMTHLSFTLSAILSVLPPQVPCSSTCTCGPAVPSTTCVGTAPQEILTALAAYNMDWQPILRAKSKLHWDYPIHTTPVVSPPLSHVVVITHESAVALSLLHKLPGCVIPTRTVGRWHPSMGVTKRFSNRRPSRRPSRRPTRRHRTCSDPFAEQCNALCTQEKGRRTWD